MELLRRKSIHLQNNKPLKFRILTYIFYVFHNTNYCCFAPPAEVEKLISCGLKHTQDLLFPALTNKNQMDLNKASNRNEVALSTKNVSSSRFRANLTL